jgi:hypothetical protein
MLKKEYARKQSGSEEPDLTRFHALVKNTSHGAQ